MAGWTRYIRLLALDRPEEGDRQQKNADLSHTINHRYWFGRLTCWITFGRFDHDKVCMRPWRPTIPVNQQKHPLSFHLHCQKLHVIKLVSPTKSTWGSSCGRIQCLFLQRFRQTWLSNSITKTHGCLAARLQSWESWGRVIMLTRISLFVPLCGEARWGHCIQINHEDDSRWLSLIVDIETYRYVDSWSLKYFQIVV
jgi:hypothetical protein